VVWLLAAPALFGVPYHFRRGAGAGVGVGVGVLALDRIASAIRAERLLPCIISGMRGVGAWALSAAVPPCRPSVE